MPSKVIYLLYRAALLVAFPFLLLYAVYRSAKTRGYGRSLGERFGWIPASFQQTAPGSIWLHAVSVGEVVSAVGLIAALKHGVPGAKVFVSVSTLAGEEIARRRLNGLADGVFFAPFDYVWIVRRVLRRLRPALVVVMETEIWPNLWRESRKAGAALVVVNGRISDKAFPKYQRWRWLFAPILAQADSILAQTGVSRDRYVALGAPAARVRLGGNLKYDFNAASATLPEPVAKFIAESRPDLVWVAASTMPPAREGDVDEDVVVADAIAALAPRFPRLLTILVPRRPERFESAAALLERRGIGFVRRSALPAASAAPVLLLDTMGELAGVFHAADVVFMGGTLAERGGHNILEPAFLGKAILFGPHMENFPEIAADFTAAGAVETISGPAQLADSLSNLLSNAARRTELGERAREQAKAKSGATALAVETCRDALENATPVPVRPLLLRWLLAPLAALWRLGSRWRRERQTASQRRLPAPVVSVGGVSAGGSGKTPFALLAGAILRDEVGRKPAFLTRGYRRVSPEPCTMADPGAVLPVALTGDEAQLLVGSGLGPVGIAADRFIAGQAVWDKFRPGAFVLDDGFQHWRLHRDVDLVMIDALDPWAGGDVIPAGRLREPLEEALRRAHAFVIMRAEPGRRYPAILRVLAAHNPTAPVFHASLEPAGWTGGKPTSPTAGLAFCGLGNPVSFRRSLERLELNPVRFVSFPDHHRYRGVDLRRLVAEARAQGATELWTTEKDAQNLPPGPVALPVRVLRVAAQLHDRVEFAAWLSQRIKQAYPDLSHS